MGFFFFCAAGDLDGFGGKLGEDLRKPPTDASPSAEIEFTPSKKMVQQEIAMPRPGGGGAPDPPVKANCSATRSPAMLVG
jgi:hypothetical protein